VLLIASKCNESDGSSTIPPEVGACSMFNAAFSSLSISCPHSVQRYILSVNSSKDFTCPQAEHIVKALE